MNAQTPGQYLRRNYLSPLNLTATDLAKALGVSQSVISRIINGKSAITPDIAVRLGMAFNLSAQTWMNLQTSHDLAIAKQKFEENPVEVVRLVANIVVPPTPRVAPDAG